MAPVPAEVIKAKLRYKCKSCGCEELIGENIMEWQMIGEPPFLRSAPRTNFANGQTGYVLPPMIIWHECHKDQERPFPMGYGICELVGLMPIRETEEKVQ